MQKIKLYVVDQDSGFTDDLEGAFFAKPQYNIQVIGHSTTLAGFNEDRQRIKQADIFIISANLPDGSGIEIVDFIRKNDVMKAKPVIFTIDKQTRNHAAIAKQRGVDKVLQKPIKFRSLIKDIYDFLNVDYEGGKEEKVAKDILGEQNEIENNLNSQIDTTSSFSNNEQENSLNENSLFNSKSEDDLFHKLEDNPLLNVTETVNENNEKENKTKVIVNFAGVSSTGKTALAVNVAYAIRNLSKVKPRVCLVDLNLLFPSVEFHFLSDELKDSSRDIYDVSADLNYLNEDLIKEALTYHEPTGIHILHTPAEPEFIHKISTVKSEQLERILVHLRDMFDVIIIDTSNAITEDLVLFPMQFADKNIVVMEPNYLNVVGVNKFFYVLKRLEGIIKEPIINKTHILLNKETKKRSIYTDTTRDYLYDKRFIVRIPEDPKFVEFTNKGKFIIDSDSVAAASLIELANFIYPIDETKSKRSKFNLFKK